MISKSLCEGCLDFIPLSQPFTMAKGQLCSVVRRVLILADVAASATSYKLLGFLNARPFFTTCVFPPSFPPVFECLTFSVTSLAELLLTMNRTSKHQGLASRRPFTCARWENGNKKQEIDTLNKRLKGCNK